MFAVAAGGILIKTVSGRRRASGAHQQIVAAPQVAREQMPPAHFQQHAGGAQDVPAWLNCTRQPGMGRKPC